MLTSRSIGRPERRIRPAALLGAASVLILGAAASILVIRGGGTRLLTLSVMTCNIHPC